MTKNLNYLFVFIFLVITMSFVSAELTDVLLSHWSGYTDSDTSVGQNTGSTCRAFEIYTGNNGYNPNITTITLKLSKLGTGKDFIIKVYTISPTTHNPVAQVGTGTVTVSASGLTTTPTDYNLTFSTPIGVTDNNRYYVTACSTAGVDGSNYSKIGGDYVITNGLYRTSSADGATWVTANSDYNYYYYLYGVQPVPPPTANYPAGTYPNGVVVALSQDQNYDIYYTIDGNAPDNTDTLYTAPITISSTTTLKAIAYDNSYYSSVLTNLYEVRPYLTTFTFKDENTTSAIPTVTITDSNGSVYTSDGSGIWSLSYSGAKSFDISKTGYDSRPLEFYFNADANYNFLLNLTGLDSNIGFIVKDSNDNLWTNKYLMFKTTDGNIINSILTSSSGTATASILANGDYYALLYDATGTLVDTYEKTTVTVNKPKNEVTLVDISPYDITVGGLLGYSLTNQSASSVSFNIFAGTTDFYYFSVVDYNATPGDRKYIPRQYFTQVPMGTGYSSALTYQPYLLLETDAVVPKITVIDELNKPMAEVDIFISRYISNIMTIVESGKTTSVGALSFSAYPLEYYYVSVIYNGVDKGTYRVQPRESTDNFIIVIDTATTTTPSTYIITADFSDTNKVVNIDDSNISVDVTVKQSQNLATTYNLYLMQNNVVKASTSGAIASRTKNITYTFDSSVVDTTNNNLVIKLVVNYPDGNQTFYYTITVTQDDKGLMYFAPKMVEDIGQPLAIILAILITGIILAGITLSGLNIGTTAVAILGILILGVFMFLGWLDIGVTVAGFDIARFFYILMSIAMIYMLMRGEQYA